MKRFQSLPASLVLVLALAAPAAAGDGTIHTGSPAPTPPPPAPSIVTDDAPVEGELAEDEPILDFVLEAARGCLHAALTLF